MVLSHSTSFNKKSDKARCAGQPYDKYLHVLKTKCIKQIKTQYFASVYVYI